MNTKTLKTLFIVESIVLLLLINLFLPGNRKLRGAGLLHEISPDGNYTLNIDCSSHSTSLYSSFDCYKITLYENSRPDYYIVRFEADISTPVGYNRYAIKWTEDSVWIVLKGYRTHYYILPFKSSEDADRLLP